MSSPLLFADGIVEVQVANGVARFALVQAPAQKDGKPEPSGQLVVPLSQVPLFARVFVDLVRQVEARAKAAQPAAEAAVPAPEPGSFRFANE
jgi:hypothetical protein